MNEHMLDDIRIEPQVFEYGPQQAAQELLRAQLDTDASQENTDTTGFRARVRVAYNVGIPVVDIQRRTGIPRQTAYNAIKHPIGSDLDDLMLLALVASGKAPSLEALESVTGASHERVRRLVSALDHERKIKTLSGTEGKTIGYYRIESDGLARLHTEIENERIRSRHDDAWTVYLGVPPELADSVEQAAKAMFGDNSTWGLIDANVSPSMSGPELAVVVRAHDPREVMFVVNGVWSQLHIDGLPPLPRVAALAPPR